MLAGLQMVKNNQVPSCGKVWDSFFKRVEQLNLNSVGSWKHQDLLYYFCTKYQSYYNCSYIFDYSKSPTKSTEMALIKKIIATTGSSNPHLWKSYIDWVFSTKISQRKNKITSLKYFLTSGFGNEFQYWHQKQQVIDRSTELPNEIKEIGKSLGIEIKTYGEIVFIQMALKTGPQPEGYSKLMDELIRMGFDFDILRNMCAD